MKERPLEWVASSRRDLRGFPLPVRQETGHALFLAQIGGKSDRSKPLRGFGDAGVLEIVEYHDGDTYRAVYTVRFARALYVLDVFKKKSKSGIATPKADMERIQRRLREAQRNYAVRFGGLS